MHSKSGDTVSRKMPSAYMSLCVLKERLSSFKALVGELSHSFERSLGFPTGEV